jgi:hypothetical protein
MEKFNVDVDKMTESQAKEVLKMLIEKLDELDEDDYFGTEGWKYYLGFED